MDVVKRFEFDHSRMTMSVLVKGPDGQHYVFIKGSFEAIAEVSNPATVPGGYIAAGKEFSLDGCYVLGVGFKKVKGLIGLACGWQSALAKVPQHSWRLPQVRLPACKWA